jgi:hypothetical protein
LALTLSSKHVWVSAIVGVVVVVLLLLLRERREIGGIVT